MNKASIKAKINDIRTSASPAQLRSTLLNVLKIIVDNMGEVSVVSGGTGSGVIDVDDALDANSNNPVQNRVITREIELLKSLSGGKEVDTIEIVAKDNIRNIIVKPSDTEAKCEFNIQYYKTSTDGTQYLTYPVQYEIYTVVDGEIRIIKTGNTTTNVMNSVSFDRKTWLGLSGTTYVFVRGRFIGSTIEVQPLGFIYTVTSLELDTSGINWHIPYIEGKSYVGLGPINIYGNVEKTLYIRVKGENYEKIYQARTDGSTSQPSNVYFLGMEMPAEGTGVYNVSLWLDADGATTEEKEYQIMFISSADEQTAKLVCVNDVKPNVVNGTSNAMFGYAFYNGGNSTAENANLIVSYLKNASVQVTDTDTLAGNTGTKYNYSPNVSVDTSEDYLSINYELTYGLCVQNATATLDNSASYTAVSNAAFFLNPGKRNNQQNNRETIINAVNGANINATYTKIAWVDGVDGYTTDDNGRNCFRIPAHSFVDANVSLMSSVLSTTRGKVLEFAFKVSNVSDYNEAVIEISSNKNSDTFSGIRIRPANITVHSNGINNPSEDAIHGYNFMDEEEIHLLVCIIPSLASVGNKNICIIYANGSKKCSFAYDAADSWTNSGHLLMGSSSADLFLYYIRTYDLSFGATDALRNYYTSLPTNEDKDIESAKDQAVLNGEDVNVEKVMTSGKNYFVVEMVKDENGNTPSLPKYGLSKSYSAQCNLEVFLQSIGHSFKLVNQKIEGQGTTSMDYDKWNLRWRVDKNSGKVCDVYYLVDGEWSHVGTLGKYDFDGVHPKLKRVTAKLNYASSMQSHKMGATSAFNDLHKACVGFDEEKDDAGINVDLMRTAIYQYPAYGFIKEWNDERNDYDYQFIGLFTIGPDKGDKDSLGWKQWDDANELISMEGVDHSPKMAQFAYPWNDEVAVAYDAVGDKTCISVVNPSSNSPIEYAWEVGNCKNLEEADWLSELETSFKPAYQLAYECGQNIVVLDPSAFGKSSAAELLSYINSNVSAFRGMTTPNGDAYSGYDFVIKGDDNIYYYRLSIGQYASSGNWFEQYTRNGGTKTKSAILAMTVSEMENTIKEQRKEYFAAHVWDYFNKKDTLFCLCFLVLFGASDNFAKNSYPYKLGNHKWRWFQDDLDTLFDINNQAIPGKEYYLEYADKQSSGAYWFNGKASNLWNTINEACQSDIRAMMQTILREMASIGYANDNSRSTWFDRLVGFVHDYFWANAQEYFSRGAYNADATYKYEDAFSRYPTLYNPGVNPLTQSLGSHYEAERQWVERRLLYAMSKYQIGPFADYTADSNMGQIVWRAVGSFNIDITPSITMFPTIIAGSNNSYIRPDDRVMAGESHSYSFDAGENDTNVYIKGADWLESVGDFKDVHLLSTNTALAVTGKRLRNWKSGDINGASVTTNVTTLEFGKCPSMEIIDCHGVGSLTSVTGTNNMLRLTEAYFGGTNLATLPLAQGAKIETLELPSTLTSLAMVDMKYLTRLTYDGLSSVTSLRVEGCQGIDQVKMLRDCMNANTVVLSKLRLTGLNQIITSADLDMFKKVADSGISGIDTTGGDTDTAVIEGKVSLGGKNVYESSVKSVTDNFKNLVVTGIGEYYIAFADSVVFEKLMTVRVALSYTLLSSDGIGITKSDALKLNSLGNTFSVAVGSPKIKTFTEFLEFRSLTYTEGTFYDQQELRLVWLPSSIKTIGYATFARCFELVITRLPEEVEVIGDSAFQNCRKVTFNNLQNVTSIGVNSFADCWSITEINLGDKLKSVGNNAFANCSSLESINLPESIETFGERVFQNDIALKTLSFPMSMTEIPQYTCSGCTGLESIEISADATSIGFNAFNDCRKLGRITLPSRLETIENFAFQNCYELELASGLPSTLTTLGAYAFANCRKILNVSIPSGVTNVGARSFSNCTGLIRLDVANGVQELGENAFYGCSSLDVVTLGDSIKSIGKSCFENSAISALQLPSNLETLGELAFKNCKNLNLTKIPTSVTALGNETFRFCSSLTLTLLNDSITEIGNYCFNECTSLRLSRLPINLVSIGTRAFDRCSSLEIDYIPSGVTFIGDGAFDNCPKITFVQMGPSTPPTMLANSFGSKVYFRVETTAILNEYRKDSVWNDIYNSGRLLVGSHNSPIEF